MCLEPLVAGLSLAAGVGVEVGWLVVGVELATGEAGVEVGSLIGSVEEIGFELAQATLTIGRTTNSSPILTNCRPASEGTATVVEAAVAKLLRRLCISLITGV